MTSVLEQELERVPIFHTKVLPSEVSIHCPPLAQTPKSNHLVCDGWKNK